MSAKKKQNKAQKDKNKQFQVTNDDGEDTLVNGDEIIKLDDGTLTTVYHFMKNSDTQIDEVLEDAKFENAEGIND